MGEDTTPGNDEEEFAMIAAIGARFSAIVTTLVQARAALKELRGFLEACGYDDPSYLADLGVCEISIAGLKKKLARMSRIYGPEEEAEERETASSEAPLNAQPSPPEQPLSVQRPTDQGMHPAAFQAAQGRPVVTDQHQSRSLGQPTQPEEHTDDPQAGC